MTLKLKCNFRLHAVVLWMINDFFAYTNLSGRVRNVIKLVLCVMNKHLQNHYLVKYVTWDIADFYRVAIYGERVDYIMVN